MCGGAGLIGDDCAAEERTPLGGRNAFVFVIDIKNLVIVQISASVRDLGWQPERILGLSVSAALGHTVDRALRLALDQPNLSMDKPVLCLLKGPSRSSLVQMYLHRSGPLLVVETDDADPRLDRSWGLLRSLGGIIARFRGAKDLGELADIAAHELQSVTGFERVCLVRDPWGPRVAVLGRSGCAASCVSCITLQDIPIAPAGQPFQLQLVADTARPSTDLIPAINPVTATRLDLAAVGLGGSREGAVALQQRGIGAVMSLRLDVGPATWGIIIGVNAMARPIDSQVRAVCEALGQAFGAQVAALEAQEAARWRQRRDAILTKMAGAIITAPTPGRVLTDHADALLGLMGAAGMRLRIGPVMGDFGELPDDAVMERLIQEGQTEIHIAPVTDIAVPGGGDRLLIIAMPVGGVVLFSRRSDLIGINPQAGRWTDDELEAAREIRRMLAARLSELERQRLERQIIRLSDTVPGMVFRLTRDVTGAVAFRFVSRGAHDILGIDPAEMVADYNHFLRLVVPEDRDKLLSAARDGVGSGAQEDRQFRIYRPDGTLRVIRAIAASNFAPDGQLVWDGIATDITAMAEAEQALTRARDEAEAGSRAKNAFLATMSHELRTPLNAIIGFADLLINEVVGPLNEQQAMFTKTVFTAGQHLLSLITEILEFSKIESGTIQLLEEVLDLGDLILGVVHLQTPSAGERGIELVVQNQAVGVVFQGDGRALRQVLLNLLSNALKFTPSGGAVTIHASADPDYGIKLSVSDTGIGIPVDQQARVFEAFHQVPPGPGREREGTGLGLTIVKALVEAHQGGLDLHSTPGVGTTVSVTLPWDRVLSRT